MQIAGYELFLPYKSNATMDKNKLIALVIWAVTLFIPFNLGFMNDPQPSFTTLIMFLLTLTGIGFGAWFFSKKSNKNNEQAQA